MKKINPGMKFRFFAMASAYFMGSFNDNFFKQSVLVIAVIAHNTDFQGYALSMFTLPFVVFAAPAGWLADRFPKRRVVIAAKWMEFAAMISGSIGILTGHWVLIFAMLAIMGTQATIFSPAINGSIPELFEEKDVVKANGILRLVVTTAILGGIACAGMALDRKGLGFMGFENGRILVAVVVICMAILGILVSYGVYSKEAMSPQAKFPWTGPIDTLRVLYETRKDRLLFISIAADLFVWSAGSLQILLLNPLGLNEFHMSKTNASMLIVAQLLGLGAGGLLSSRFAKGKRWYRSLILPGFLMSFFMIMITLVPCLPESAAAVVLFPLVGLVGFFGGLLLIPLESFIQIRPSADRKGTVWASANFAIFSGILLTGPISNGLNAAFLPSQAFGIMGIVSLILSVSLFIIFRKGELV
jgi:acyl-[acyl-carrier-protein]-phospholipid O-acyltransferase / long-chain-fatty-acid--[acyl-carrier-protein] ligase